MQVNSKQAHSRLSFADRRTSVRIPVACAFCLAVSVAFGGCSIFVGGSDETSFAADYAFEVHMAGADSGDPQRDNTYSGPQPLDRLIAEAESNHPSIMAAANRLTAAQENLNAALDIKDPRLSITAGVEPVQTAAGPQRAAIALSQEVPRLAKLEARVIRAQTEVDSAQATLAIERARVAEEVRHAYADLFEAEMLYRLAATQKALLDRVSGIAEAKYQTGQIGQQEWKDSLIVADEMENRRIDQQGKIGVMQRRLTTAIGLNPAVSIETLPNLPAVDLIEDRDTYAGLANEVNPELQRSRIEMRLRQIEVDLKCLERRPDPTLSATWISVDEGGISPVANGRDSVLVGVSVGLPVFRDQLEGKVQNAAALANAQVEEHRSLKLTQQANVLAQYESVASQIDQIVRLENSILPSAEDVFNTSMQEFQVDRVTYEQLTDYWQRLFALQEQRVQIQVSMFKNFASLIRLMGGQLPTEESGKAPASGGPLPPQGVTPNGFEGIPTDFQSLPPASARRVVGY